MSRRSRPSTGRGGPRARTVALTGGGSGGHITPILAVAAALKRQDPDLRVIYIGQRGDKLGDVPRQDPNIDATYQVSAGKFRRYHGEGFFRQLLDIPTMAKNTRDFFLALAGIWQSWRLIGRLRPDMVFSRGGFVSVPVCLGAALHRIPYMTHDSDPVPSLANRLIAPWARLHAVALPGDYPYPKAKTAVTGIPLNEEFKPVTAALKKRYRQEIKLSATARLLFVIGGGLGSQGINRAVAAALPNLLGDFQDLHVVHVVGRANQDEMSELYAEKLSAEEQGRVQVLGFIPDVYRYSGAADIVVCRAGATNLAEFALQGKACVVVPGTFLAGGHQIHNAGYLSEHDAAVVIGEDELAEDPNRLSKRLAGLLNDPSRIDSLGAKLAAFGRPDAAEIIAKLILEQSDASRKA